MMIRLRRVTELHPLIHRSHTLNVGHFEMFNTSESSFLRVQEQKCLETSGSWTFGYSVPVENCDTDDAKVIKLSLMARQGFLLRR